MTTKNLNFMSLIQDDRTEEQHSTITIVQMAKEVWPMGFISYGGPMAHIGLFRERFITNLKWIDEDRFNELTTICQSVPGPTSTQLMISLATYVTGNVYGGIVAFLLFFGPSFLVMTLCGLFLSQAEVPMLQLTIQFSLKELLHGFQVAAVGVVLQAFWGLSEKYRKDKDSIVLFSTCAVVYILFPTVVCMFALFTASVIYCVYYKEIEVKAGTSSDESKIFGSIVFGKISILAFFGLLVVSILIKGSPSIVENEMAVFYKIGSVIIGGGHVILPMMWTEFKPYSYFSEHEFWNGFSLVSCLPGPMFNMAAYVGALINGVVGSVCCCIALYIPSFLTIWAVLPYWQQYRSIAMVQKVIYGLCCASIGFILAAVAMLWVAACMNPNPLDTLLNTGISCLAFYLLQVKKVEIPYVILGGGLKFLLKQLIFH